MSRKTRTTLLFVDFHGTLCSDKFWRTLDEKTRNKVEAVLFGSNVHLIESWMRGEVRSEDILSFAANTLEMDYATLWSQFVFECETMSVSVSALNRISELRRRFVTVLITGNMDSFSRFTVPALGLEGYFDQIVNSADCGRLKNDGDGELFLEICEAWRIPIERSLLIDDSPDLIELFRNLGGIAYSVRRPGDLDRYLDALMRENLGKTIRSTRTNESTQSETTIF